MPFPAFVADDHIRHIRPTALPGRSIRFGGHAGARQGKRHNRQGLAGAIIPAAPAPGTSACRKRHQGRSPATDAGWRDPASEWACACQGLAHPRSRTPDRSPGRA